MKKIEAYLLEEMEKDLVRIGADVDYNFAKLMEHRKNDLSMRLKSNWSYDTLRSPDFEQAAKIKKRIVA
jgi:hypothetical protein